MIGFKEFPSSLTALCIDSIDDHYSQNIVVDIASNIIRYSSGVYTEELYLWNTGKALDINDIITCYGKYAKACNP